MALSALLRDFWFPLYTSVFFGSCFALFAGSLLEARHRAARPAAAVLCAALRIALLFLIPNESESGPTVIRILILLGAQLGFLFAFFRPKPFLAVYVALSWSAVFELAFYIAYSVILACDPLYARVSEQYIAGASRDPEQYAAALRTIASVSQVLMAALFTILCTLACRSISRNLKGPPGDMNRAEFRLLALPGAVGLLICILLRILSVSLTEKGTVFLFDTYPVLRVLVPAAAAACLASVVSAAGTCREMWDLEEQRRAALAAEQRLRALREQVRETQSVNDHMRKMRHDLKNTLLVIRELASELPESDLQQYVSDLTEDMKKLERPFASGDPVADILLAAKRRAVLEKVPEAAFDADGFRIAEHTGISSYDLGILLGNALDNAAEALEAQAAGEKFIRLRSSLYDDMLLLSIENSCRKGVVRRKDDGLPVSTKNGGHGIGLRNIRDIAEKYAGTMDWKMEKGIFTLAVLLKTDKKAVIRDAADAPAPGEAENRL